ncbi:hypothetical protein [Acinetobacter sp. ANC 3813]|uniref:hypothetical protein n=1 Tax=Acinetobacter sp. ANC 3813 TaxID=1977873 RepID=UPI000A341D29|nr:hypothetical protein [Acinetobacter sp. ANC 3813]OTG87907.1 hypothetical protein B9T34_16365 [Acinetobacter sp. ANC 3813]
MNKGQQYFKEHGSLPAGIKHRTCTGYQYGCRCDLCTNAAISASANSLKKQKEHFKEHGVLLSFNHGVSGYAAGCRCDVCAKSGGAGVKLAKEYFLKHGEFKSSSTKHGSETGYRYGCRCDKCVDAIRRRDQCLRKSKKQLVKMLPKIK